MKENNNFSNTVLWNKSVQIAFELVAVIVIFSSCNTTKHLESGKYFLVKNEIAIKDKIKNKGNLTDELGSLYKQNPTSKARRWFFYKTKGRLKNRFGENPTVFDESKSELTAQNIKYYLQNRGYYDAVVKYNKVIKGKKAKVKYNVNLNAPFVIDEIHYKSSDEDMVKIMESAKEESFLKKGKLLDVNLYNAEITRLTKVIRNFGYANFYANYFTPLDADTLNHKANITLEVLSPEDTIKHRKYDIRNIYILTEYVAEMPSTRKDTMIDGLLFTAPSGVFNFKLSELVKCVPIRPGEAFRQENLDLMYSRFQQLQSFRLINIKQVYPTLTRNKVDIVVTLAQITKYAVDGNFELNNTVGGTRSSALGLSSSLSFKNNNVFKGGEKYIGNIEGGIQGLLLDKKQRFGDFKFQNEYYVPKSVDVYGFWKRLNNISFGETNSRKINTHKRKLVSDQFYQSLKSNSRTKLTLGYNYINTYKLQYQLINLNYGYVVTPNAYKKVSFNHTSLEWLKPIQVDSSLTTFQHKRFKEQFVTSLLFRDLMVQRTGGSSKHKTNWTLRTSLEQSGLELYAANILYNTIALNNKSFNIFGSDYTRYAKTEIDYALGKKFTESRSLHLRFNTGIAVPYGFNTAVPFVKQFYVGGSSSLRGWQTRQLGPGAYINDNNASNQLYYQTGDIKLETNAEYRFGIYWIFKGAFFVDAGNVWLLKPDASLPNAEISSNFYKQIAVSSGVGLRIDFNYSVIRFDFAYRLRTPYLNADTGSHATFTSLGNLLKSRVNPSIALAYPF